MRYLGVDFGAKRIGLAIAVTEPLAISPRPCLAASGTLSKDASSIAEFVRAEDVDAVVLGLPLDISGELGKMARVVTQLGDQIAAQGLRVHLVDERFTSVEAESRIRGQDHKGSFVRKHKDGEAACIILERFLYEAENR